MNKTIIYIVLLILTTLDVSGQTYYYKQVKKVIGNKVSTNVSGGQFITFIGDICYESDKKGIGVGHGKLSYRRALSNQQIKVYTGGNYWGSNAVFKFTRDLNTMNVVTEAGDVYLYKRMVPPTNVKTCSLIRKPSSSGGNSIIIPDNTPIIAGNNGLGGYNGYGGNSNSTTNSNTSKQTRTKPTRYECSACHGKGRIVYDTYPPLYGATNDNVWCSECSRSWPRSFGHTHITCPTCHGKGYFTTE